MQWLAENIQAILAAVGSVFVALRAIVALTPTPKDDQLIKKAETKYMKILGFISKGMGLDTTQGVKEKKIPTIPVSIICCVLIFFSTGCVSNSVEPIIETESGKLLLSQISFSSTVRTLTALNNANTFDEEEQVRITILINTTDTYLKEWETSNKIGVSRPDIIKYLIPLMLELEKAAGIKQINSVNNLTP